MPKLRIRDDKTLDELLEGGVQSDNECRVVELAAD